MAKFVCSSCKYKFLLKTKERPDKCPWCSKEGSVGLEQSASELISEVDESS